MASPLRPVESHADLEVELAPFVRDRSLLLVGGADFARADPATIQGIHTFLATLAGHCEATGTAVVDGGTDAGVMRWFAEARAGRGGTFPLVGVAPRFAFERPTRSGRPISVAPEHSLVLAVPGEHFGDETRWLFAAADHLGAGRPAATVLVNGGDLAASEARMRLADGHVVVAVAGSGRAADELASEGEGGGGGGGEGGGPAESGLRESGRLPGSGRLRESGGLRESGRLRVIPMAADELSLAAALEEAWDA